MSKWWVAKYTREGRKITNNSPPWEYFTFETFTEGLAYEQIGLPSEYTMTLINNQYQEMDVYKEAFYLEESEESDA
jgi:hypothetical protein